MKIGLDYSTVSDDTMDTSQLMNVDSEEERQDDEKNMIVSKMVDLCLTLTEHLIRLKDLIESSTMKRRRKAEAPPQYSYAATLIDPFIRDIRQRQQQEQEQQKRQRIDDDDDEDDVGMSEEESDCEDMIDCSDSRRVVSLPPPFKRQKLM